MRVSAFLGVAYFYCYLVLTMAVMVFVSKACCLFSLRGLQLLLLALSVRQIKSVLLMNIEDCLTFERLACSYLNPYSS